MLRHLATTAVSRMVGGARGSYSRVIAGHNSRWVSAYSTEGDDDKADAEAAEEGTGGGEEGAGKDYDDSGEEGVEGEEVEAADGDDDDEGDGGDDGHEDVVGGGGGRGGGRSAYKLPQRFTGDDYGLIDVDDDLIDWSRSDVPKPASWANTPRVKMTAVVPFFPMRDPEWDEEDEEYDEEGEDDPELTYEDEEEDDDDDEDEEEELTEEEYRELMAEEEQKHEMLKLEALARAIEEVQQEEGVILTLSDEERAKLMRDIDDIPPAPPPAAAASGGNDEDDDEYDDDEDTVRFTEEEKAMMSDDEKAAVASAVNEHGEDLENYSDLDAPGPLHVDDVEREGWLYDMAEKGESVDHHPGAQNAHISDYTKTLMFVLHTKDPKMFDEKRLASDFKLRRQRVMAILALKKIQYEAEQNGTQPLFPDLTAAFEEMHGSADMGNDDRHVRIVPSLPKFQVIPQGTTPERMKQLLPKFFSPEEEAMREENLLVKQFKAALEYNLCITAPGLNRKGRFKHPGKRPEGGWGLMVIPMVESNAKKVNKRAKREGWSNEPEKPYVAYPDGTKRDVNEDEKEMFRRRTIRPYRRSNF